MNEIKAMGDSNTDELSEQNLGFLFIFFYIVCILPLIYISVSKLTVGAVAFLMIPSEMLWDKDVMFNVSWILLISMAIRLLITIFGLYSIYLFFTKKYRFLKLMKYLAILLIVDIILTFLGLYITRNSIEEEVLVEITVDNIYRMLPPVIFTLYIAFGRSPKQKFVR